MVGKDIFQSGFADVNDLDFQDYSVHIHSMDLLNKMKLVNITFTILFVTKVTSIKVFMIHYGGFTHFIYLEKIINLYLIILSGMNLKLKKQ